MGCVCELRVCKWAARRVRAKKSGQWILPVDKQEVVALWVRVVPDNCTHDFETRYYTHDWSPDLEWPRGGGLFISGVGNPRLQGTIVLDYDSRAVGAAVSLPRPRS